VVRHVLQIADVVAVRARDERRVSAREGEGAPCATRWECGCGGMEAREWDGRWAHLRRSSQVVWLVSARYVCSAHREPTSNVHTPSTSEPTSATALARGHASNVEVCTYDVLQLMDIAHTTSAVCARPHTRWG
jgi:hypothetical protein